MSQKAWMSAYTKGSKSLQARLAKIHANNPEFQEFVKKHGFGGNLSKKQSELQKKTSVGTVKPVDQAHPEMKAGVDREALIKAAAQKIQDRRRAHANRVAFGGELGGGFGLHNMGFRTYREARELSDSERDEIAYSNELKREKTQNEIRKHRDELRKKMKKGFTYTPKKWVEEELRVGDKVRLKKDWAGSEHRNTVFTVHHKNSDGDYWIGHGPDKRGWYVGDHQVTKVKSVREDIDYKGGDKLRMRKGGWVVIRGGKQHGVIHPTKEYAQAFSDATRETLATKVGTVLRKKAKEIARGMGRYSYATESAANRRRIRSWDSAIMPELRPLTVKPKKKEPPFTPDKPKNNLGIVVGKNDPGYSRARHLARLGLKKAMEQNK